VRRLSKKVPQVMYSVFKSSPPNRQLVTVSSGVSINASSFPCGEMT
jgi:hypothetical protein